MMAPAIPRVKVTIMGAKLLGKICRHSIVLLLKPNAFADCTYSCSFNCNTCPRTNRAMPGHVTRPTARNTTFKLGSSAAVIPMRKSSVGKPNIISVQRIMIVSILPPDIPERAPSNTPSTRAMMLALKPTVSEIRAPWMIRDKISRPN